MCGRVWQSVSVSEKQKEIHGSPNLIGRKGRGEEIERVRGTRTDDDVCTSYQYFIPIQICPTRPKLDSRTECLRI